MIAKYLRRYPFTVFVACVVIVISLIPFPEMPKLDDVPFVDKWTHMVMYGGLCSVLWIEYLRRHSMRVEIRKATLLGLVCPIVMSGTLELAQEYLTESRSGEWLDLLANSVGAFAAYLVCMAVAKKR